jgi:uncharacterized phage protein gp47/JayE
MAFERPTLTELVERVQQDFVSRLSLAGAVLRRSTVNVLARVVAGASHMMHGHLDFVSRQQFPDTSEGAFLHRQGSVYGIEPLAPDFAHATVTITGVSGTTVDAGTILVRADGVEYTTDAPVTLASGTGTAAITARVAGAAGSLSVAMQLTFESPVVDVDATATVAAVTQDGVDAESDDAFRTRLLDHLRNPPQGGALTDYEQWAKEIAGVTRVWVYPGELGAGSVVVRFVRDNDPGLIPDSGEVAAVQAHLQDKRPVTAIVTTVAPVAAPVAYSLHIVPDTTAVRAAVTAELDDLHARAGEPGGTLLLSEIRTAIGVAAGLTDYTLASPAADVTNTTGNIPTRGTITFT